MESLTNSKMTYMISNSESYNGWLTHLLPRTQLWKSGKRSTCSTRICITKCFLFYWCQSTYSCTVLPSVIGEWIRNKKTNWWVITMNLIWMTLITFKLPSFITSLIEITTVIWQEYGTFCFKTGLILLVLLESYS